MAEVWTLWKASALDFYLLSLMLYPQFSNKNHFGSSSVLQFMSSGISFPFQPSGVLERSFRLSWATFINRGTVCACVLMQPHLLWMPWVGHSQWAPSLAFLSLSMEEVVEGVGDVRRGNPASWLFLSKGFMVRFWNFVWSGFWEAQISTLKHKYIKIF